MSIDISTGFAEADRTRDILKLIVIERYTGEGKAGQGFVNGFGIKNGAIASTVAHDSHNLIICGDNDLSMKTAGNHLIKIGGGLVVVENDAVIASLPLPIAGIMSNHNALEVARIEGKLNEAAKTIGISLSDPFMTISFLALPVIPELKLTDKGLVDVGQFTLTSLFL